MNINEFEQEGRNILDFWIKYAFQKEKPLFYFIIDEDNKPGCEMYKTKANPEGAALLISARCLWAFSKGYEIFGDEKYLKAADRAFEGYPLFRDSINGGFHTFIFPDEKFDRKKIYDHAFAIYGLSQYYFVSKKKEALDLAFEIFDFIEEVACDKELGGYYNHFSVDWKPTEQPRRYPENTVKDMNCMLHLLEAYTLFYDVTKDEKVLDALKKLTRITLDKIVNKETGHLNMYFDRKLNVLSDEITCGHDIETSWLLWETALVLDDEELKKEIKEATLLLANAGLRDGFFEEHGGIFNKTKKGLHTNWWEQAEAVVGTYNVYSLTGEEKYLSYSEKIWEFIKRVFIYENGEWRDSLFIPFESGEYIFPNPVKVTPWKCPYHNFRMCAEMMRRITK